MDNNCCIYIYDKHGHPVALSSGVRVDGNLNALPIVRVLTRDCGSLMIPIYSAWMGKPDPVWSGAAHYPHHPRDARDWRNPDAFPLANLSSFSVFWVDDPAGSHILMDPKRKLRQVSPAPEEIQSGFWTQIRNGIEDPAGNFFSASERKKLYEATSLWRSPVENSEIPVWFCVHPAPLGAVWGFDCVKPIGIEITAPGHWEPAMEFAIDQEAYYGPLLVG